MLTSISAAKDYVHDKALRITRNFSGAPTWPGALSDDSDQSCYGEPAVPRALSKASNVLRSISCNVPGPGFCI